MSIFSLSRFSNASLRMLANVVGQTVVLVAAAAGVLMVAGGCRPSPEQFQQMQLRQHEEQSRLAMRSAISSPPESTLIDPRITGDTPKQQQPPAAGRGQAGAGARTAQPAATFDPVASPRELKLSHADVIKSTINDATLPMPAPAPNGGSALRTAEKVVLPLADTLAAIDTAQRAVVENLRNAEVPGFKASRTACGDGRDVTSQVDVTQGELQPTQRALDVAIQGDGFLQIRVYTIDKREGMPAFTRNGRLYVAKDNQLVVGEEKGYKLLPPIAVPVGTTEISIGQDGTVRATQASAEKPGPQAIGRVSLARFTDPSALQSLGGGIYAETDASGPAVDSLPAERGAGAIMQGFLEASNVDLIKERLRLRFLQSWRGNILAAIDGELPATAVQEMQLTPPQAPLVRPVRNPEER